MRIFAIFIVVLISVVGCSRQPKGFTEVKFQTPASSQTIGILPGVPAGRTVCYGVSVRGPGITPTPASSCKPEIGTTLGFVNEGGVLQGQVLKGKDRTIDIYLYLQATGENLPCPVMAGGFATIPSTKLYRIGTLSNIELIKETETITIPTTFPGEAQHLVAANSYPASCIPTPAVYRGYQISSDVAVVTGTGFIMKGRVGRTNQESTLTGTGFQLKVKN